MFGNRNDWYCIHRLLIFVFKHRHLKYCIEIERVYEIWSTLNLKNYRFYSVVMIGTYAELVTNCFPLVWVYDIKSWDVGGSRKFYRQVRIKRKSYSYLYFSFFLLVFTSSCTLETYYKQVSTDQNLFHLIMVACWYLTASLFGDLSLLCLCLHFTQKDYIRRNQNIT